MDSRRRPVAWRRVMLGWWWHWARCSEGTTRCHRPHSVRSTGILRPRPDALLPASIAVVTCAGLPVDIPVQDCHDRLRRKW